MDEETETEYMAYLGLCCKTIDHSSTMYWEMEQIFWCYIEPMRSFKIAEIERKYGINYDNREQ